MEVWRMSELAWDSFRTRCRLKWLLSKGSFANSNILPLNSNRLFGKSEPRMLLIACRCIHH